MSRKHDLEKLIRDSYEIISEYEASVQTASDPDTMTQGKNMIEKHWEAIEDYLNEYWRLADGQLPPDIFEIASHFYGKVQIFLSGKFASFTEERRSAFIAALAVLLNIPPLAIVIQSVYRGSIILDLGLPLGSVFSLRYLLQSNNAKLRLLRIERVLILREDEKESWSLRGNKYVVATHGALAASERSLPDKRQPNLHCSQIGVIGDHAHVEGGIHFHSPQRLRPPLQRPPRAEHFTGRQDELAQLLQDLQQGKVVTLCGPGGIGKSALAAEAIWTLAPADELPPQFPDGIVFYSFYGGRETDKALDAIAEAYGETRSGSAAVVQRILSDSKMLLVLDGADEANDLEAVLKLRGSNCCVLITSRKLGDAPSDPRHLDSLSQDDAITLLQTWADYEIVGDTAIKICELVGCLPLAVSLIGRYLNIHQGAINYLTWLEKTPLDALDLGKRRNESVPVLLKKSLDQVDKADRQVLAVVGCLALTPFDCEPIAKAMNLPPNQVPGLLNSLVNFGLLIHNGGDYRISHALVHTYVREKEQPRSRVLMELATYYTETSKDETREQSGDYSWQDKNRPHILSVLDCCVARKKWKKVQGLAFAIDDYLEKRGHWIERIRSLEMGKKAAEELGDCGNEAKFWGMLGRTYRALGQAQKALNFYDHALSMVREMDDRWEEGRWLGHKGSAYRSLGKYQDAMPLYQKALDIAREVGDRKREGVESGRLGLCYQLQGEPGKAISEHERALQLARESPCDRRQESVQLGFLGRAYRSLGQIDEAFKCHCTALEIAQREGHRQEESVQLGCLGLVCSAQGKISKAMDYHHRALQIAREIGNRWEEEYNLGHLGNVYRDLGEYDKAIEYYIDSLKQAIEINDFRGEGIRLSGLGTVYHILGWDKEAVQCQRETQLIADILQDRLGQSYALLHLGSVELAAGHLDTARQMCQQSCNLDSPETGYQAALMLGIISLHRQAQMTVKVHDCEDAKAAFEDCVRRCRVLLDRTPDLYKAQYVLATALVGQSVCAAGNLHQDVPTESLAHSAIEYYKKAIEICSTAGVIYDVINKLELIQHAGVRGLEPFFDLLKAGLSPENFARTVRSHEPIGDFARQVSSPRNQAFRRWRLGLHLQESDPREAEQLMLKYVDYLRANNDPELRAAAEHVAYVHETISPGLGSAGDCRSYLHDIGHPDPDEGVKGVARMKAQNYLERALVILEEIRSPNAARIRSLLATLADKSYE